MKAMKTKKRRRKMSQSLKLMMTTALTQTFRKLSSLILKNSHCVKPSTFIRNHEQFVKTSNLETKKKKTRRIRVIIRESLEKTLTVWILTISKCISKLNWGRFSTEVITNTI